MRSLALVCCLVLASTALSKSLESLFVSGTKIGSNVLRLTLRGILPFPNEFVAHPRFVDDGWRALLEHNAPRQYLLIYPMPDLETAFAHQNGLTMPLLQGLYLINPQLEAGASLDEVDFAELSQSPQTTIALYEGGEWHDGEPTDEMRANRWRYLNYAELQQYLPDATNQANFAIDILPALPHYGNAPFFAQPTFGLSKVIGINHTDVLQERRTKKILSKTSTLFKRGYHIVFNEDIEPSITALQNQPRHDQSLEMNRYRIDDVADNLRNAFAAGKAFTALLRAPDGETVAGAVGYLHNNVYSPDSVFYRNIDEAKVVYISMLRYLWSQGISFTNAGMVTPFTANIGGYRITERDYQDLLTQLPSTPVSLPTSGWRDSLAIVVPTAKFNQQRLEALIAQGKVPTPLLLLNSSSGEQPAHKSGKNNARTASLERLLANLDNFVIYEPNLPPWQASGNLPERLQRYFAAIRNIEVMSVEGISFLMRVHTLSGFPASLLVE